MFKGIEIPKFISIIAVLMSPSKLSRGVGHSISMVLMSSKNEFSAICGVFTYVGRTCSGRNPRIRYSFTIIMFLVFQMFSNSLDCIREKENFDFKSFFFSKNLNDEFSLDKKLLNIVNPVIILNFLIGLTNYFVNNDLNNLKCVEGIFLYFVNSTAETKEVINLYFLLFENYRYLSSSVSNVNLYKSSFCIKVFLNVFYDLDFCCEYTKKLRCSNVIASFEPIEGRKIDIRVSCRVIDEYGFKSYQSESGDWIVIRDNLSFTLSHSRYLKLLYCIENKINVATKVMQFNNSQVMHCWGFEHYLQDMSRNDFEVYEKTGKDYVLGAWVVHCNNLNPLFVLHQYKFFGKVYNDISTLIEKSPLYLKKFIGNSKFKKYISDLKRIEELNIKVKINEDLKPESESLKWARQQEIDVVNKKGNSITLLNEELDVAVYGSNILKVVFNEEKIKNILSGEIEIKELSEKEVEKEPILNLNKTIEVLNLYKVATKKIEIKEKNEILCRKQNYKVFLWRKVKKFCMTKKIRLTRNQKGNFKPCFGRKILVNPDKPPSIKRTRESEDWSFEEDAICKKYKHLKREQISSLEVRLKHNEELIENDAPEELEFIKDVHGIFLREVNKEKTNYSRDEQRIKNLIRVEKILLERVNNINNSKKGKGETQSKETKKMVESAKQQKRKGKNPSNNDKKEGIKIVEECKEVDKKRSPEKLILYFKSKVTGPVIKEGLESIKEQFEKGLTQDELIYPKEFSKFSEKIVGNIKRIKNRRRGNAKNRKNEPKSSEYNPKEKCGLILTAILTKNKNDLNVGNKSKIKFLKPKKIGRRNWNLICGRINKEVHVTRGKEPDINPATKPRLRKGEINDYIKSIYEIYLKSKTKGM